MTGDAFHERVRAALARLDGTTGSAVALLAGITRTELDALGGVSEHPRPPATIDAQPRTGPDAPTGRGGNAQRP